MLPVNNHAFHKAMADQWESYFNIAGFSDLGLLILCALVDIYVFTDDQMKLEYYLTGLLLGWQLVILVVPTPFFLMAYLDPDAQRAVTSQGKSKKNMVHNYRLAYQVKVYGGCVYMAAMLFQFIFFENYICTTGLVTSLESGDICVFLLEILDGVVVVCFIVNIIWCGYLLKAIQNYEKELRKLSGED